MFRRFVVGVEVQFVTPLDHIEDRPLQSESDTQCEAHSEDENNEEESSNSGDVSEEVEEDEHETEVHVDWRVI